MKTRLIAVFLVIVLTSGLAACGEFAALEPAVEFLQAGKEENTIVIPEAVLKLSEEDDILLNGELKDGVYQPLFRDVAFRAGRMDTHPPQ